MNSSKQKHVAGAKRDQVTIGWDSPEITQTAGVRMV